jgi:methanogenic corrinoid protein MtbC1
VAPPRGGRSRDYDQADVERLIILRRLVEKGHAIGSIARLADADLRALLAESSAAVDNSGIVQKLLADLENFDYAALNDRIGRMAALLPPRELVRTVAFPMMREVGARWHRGELTVAQEHMITGLIQNVLGTLLSIGRPAPGAPRVVFATPENERHSLGILAGAMLAPSAGLSPIYLGPALPAQDIILAAKRSGARAVVLQITDSSSSTQSEVRKIIGGLPSHVELWLGGDVEFKFERALVLRHFSELGDQFRRLAVTA